jgi:hypothetical protein
MLVRVHDWTVLKGGYVEVRHRGRTVCLGIAVTTEEGLVWIQPFAGPRQPFVKEDGYEIWADIGRFLYLK